MISRRQALTGAIATLHIAVPALVRANTQTPNTCDLEFVSLDTDAMEPTTSRRGSVIVDRTVTEFRGEGLYLIGTGGAKAVRRVSYD